MNTKTKAIQQKAKNILSSLNLKPMVPQDPREWKTFVHQLRVTYLGFTLEEFWQGAGLSQSSGSKYENISDGSRPITRRIMLKIADVYDLDWELTHAHTNTVLLAPTQLTETDRRLLQILKDNHIDEAELQSLLQIVKALGQLPFVRGSKN